jgi:quercetin dioxygenase-like cupin family protein
MIYREAREGIVMNSFGKCVNVALATLCGGLVVAHFTWSRESDSGAHNRAKDRARILLSQPLPKLDGNHLKVVLVEVLYGPGEASLPHSHPCAVIGYVVEGELRTQVEGEPEMIYKTGETFYEAADGVHLVSANASSTAPAKLVAYMICDHNAPLSVDVSARVHPKGESR